jgi:hypothetical protein
MIRFFILFFNSHSMASWRRIPGVRFPKANDSCISLAVEVYVYKSLQRGTLDHYFKLYSDTAVAAASTDSALTRVAIKGRLMISYQIRLELSIK